MTCSPGRTHKHALSFGGEMQSIDADFYLGVFQQGNIQAVEDFPDFDRNGDGKVDDNDLLFAVACAAPRRRAPSISPTTTTTTSPASRRTTGRCCRT